VLEEIGADGGLSDATRFSLPVAAFDRISNYDAAISDYLSAMRRPTARAASSRARATAAS
jgi:phosphoribosylaminoimidazolecarboxamide formyltransferase/IMP cyclohydrolase